MTTLTTRGRIHRLATVLVGAVGLAAVAPAQATLFEANLAPQTIDADGPDFIFDFAAPQGIVSDALLTLTLDGDFNTSTETASVFVDGIELITGASGAILDEIPGNDPFDFGIAIGSPDDPDRFSGAGDPFSGSATLSKDFLSSTLR